MKFVPSQAVQAVLINDIHQEKEETFGNFFENWITEQNKDLEELVLASKEYNDKDQSEELLGSLIDRVFQHYEHYYAEKSGKERCAFHLLYSKCGIQLEAKLSELVRGFASRDLGDLSVSQLRKVDELQRKTIKEEKEISEKHAKQQETVADASMVKLSNVETEMIRMGEDDRRGEDMEEQVEITPKEEAELHLRIHEWGKMKDEPNAIN
ncbi:hypothetical protein LIER_16087 [Lithospermum erythrorhizon]|uniref:DOG1 domain-containing protein n=1 Tax=Lithospermum erythrorhizon TaxID=34254 RepID=A0AAV3Q5C9_LITER